MSTSKTSHPIGLRFGVEIELVVRSKNRTHATFEGLASEICQHLTKAKISSHIGDLSQKADATETYQDWTIIQDLTLPSAPAENLFGVELVSPIFYFHKKHTWVIHLQNLWKVLETNFEVHATNECSTHIHLSPANGPWSLTESKGIAHAAVYFERCIDALLPGHRRINPYCMSNRRNPRYNHLPLPVIFQDISQVKSNESLAENMCWCSKDSIHAQNTLHEDDFVHPHFRWNFTPLTDRKGTIEFRQPPASQDASETMAWVLFAVCFAQWASERASAFLDPTRTAELAELYKCVMVGARLSGVPDGTLQGLLEKLFREAKQLPVARYDLKRITEDEDGGIRMEAHKGGMSSEKFKELFGYE